MKDKFANYKNNAKYVNIKVHNLHIKLIKKSLMVIYITSNVWKNMMVVHVIYVNISEFKIHLSKANMSLQMDISPPPNKQTNIYIYYIYNMVKYGFFS